MKKIIETEVMTDIDKLDAFTRGYIEAALWSSTTESGVPLDDEKTIEDIAPETLAGMAKDCALFQERYEALIRRAWFKSDTKMDASACGHDFWLTRCGHGAGFWDRGLGEIGEALTAACGFNTEFSNVDLYIGDDGRIYAS